jgi:hypothetical protein
MHSNLMYRQYSLHARRAIVRAVSDGVIAAWWNEKRDLRCQFVSGELDESDGWISNDLIPPLYLLESHPINISSF